MFSMTYVSASTHSFDEPELDYLLQRSREWNAGHGLSGLLLFKSGAFMQAIEGDERAVRKTFRRRIRRDSRHGDIRVLHAGEIATRSFPEWTMGYRRVAGEAESDIAGYDDFLSRGDFGPSWGSPTPARVLLDWFRLYSDVPSVPAPPVMASGTW
jgi:hypothetical protein